MCCRCASGKIEELTPTQKAIKKLQAEREKNFEQVKEASRKRLAKDVATKASEYERASPEEVKELGDLFARQLRTELPYGVSNPHKLFKHVDVDGSGRITFDEFSRMVTARPPSCTHGCTRPQPIYACTTHSRVTRMHAHSSYLKASSLPQQPLPPRPCATPAQVRGPLKLGEKALSGKKLWGLWRSIDENENGFICAGTSLPRSPCLIFSVTSHAAPLLCPWCSTRHTVYPLCTRCDERACCPPGLPSTHECTH